MCSLCSTRHVSGDGLPSLGFITSPQPHADPGDRLAEMCPGGQVRSDWSGREAGREACSPSSIAGLLARSIELHSDLVPNMKHWGRGESLNAGEILLF